jgi:hypothetical protein
MKKGLLWSIIALAAIIIVASFGMQVGNITPQEIPESMTGQVLYVCPAADSAWHAIALATRPFTNYVLAAFFFCLVLLLFGWGWQLYQNLLSDKFKRESFKTIWVYTKWGFWALILVILILVTPNEFRRVSVTNAGDNWVLCDATDPDARAVRADAVHSR